MSGSDATFKLARSRASRDSKATQPNKMASSSVAATSSVKAEFRQDAYRHQRIPSSQVRHASSRSGRLLQRGVYTPLVYCEELDERTHQHNWTSQNSISIEISVGTKIAHIKLVVAEVVHGAQTCVKIVAIHSKSASAENHFLLICLLFEKLSWLTDALVPKREFEVALTAVL